MSSSVRGFTLRDLTQHGKPEVSQVVVNFGKVLPATATGSIFAVTGIVVIQGLFGIVSTIFSATTVKPSIGVTGLNTAIAAQPAVGFTSTAVGSVIQAPLVLGGALPAAVVASGAAAGACNFVVNAANITVTTDATNTGAITWVLSYAPLYPKKVGSVAAV